VKKIKDFREQNGWTQTDLADKTGLSLRTIQRVESGHTIPKGHTLKMLSDLFGVKPSEFKSEDTQITYRHIEHLKLINLSALAVILIPFGNILFPFMVWRRNKEDRIINRAGRYILNFQIIWTLVLSLLLLISPFIQLSLQLPFSLIIVILILSYCFNVLMIFKFSKWISNRDLERLKVTLQLL
jgi:transcriptional regulator with XRE-family HTH domain